MAFFAPTWSWRNTRRNIAHTKRAKIHPNGGASYPGE
jgi:hypothetical protein